MQYEFRIRVNLTHQFGGEHLRYYDECSWGIDEYDALDKYLRMNFKEIEPKYVVATARILATGRTRNHNKKALPFIPIPIDYTPNEKGIVSYYWIRIHHAEVIAELEELKEKFEGRISVRDLTEEHQVLFRTLIAERSKSILTGEIKPYIYSLGYEVPDECSSSKKFTYYVNKAIKNLKIAGYRIRKNDIKFEITASEWHQQTFSKPKTQFCLPVEVILYWEHIAHLYKEVNDFVDVLPKSHDESVVGYIGMQKKEKLDAHLNQLNKHRINYWLSIEDEMDCVYVVQDDYIKAKKLVSTIKPRLLQSIDDYIVY